MMELRELQKLFHEAVFNKGGEAERKVCSLIEGAGGLQPESAFALYRGSILGKFQRALRATYPVCLKLVGEEFFNAAARVFIDRYPSRSPDLDDYGKDLADFFDGFKPAESLPYLADVARVEWALHSISKEGDAPPFDMRQLAAVRQAKWGNLIFFLPENRYFLQSDYPLDLIWRLATSQGVEREAVNLDEGHVNLFLWRDRDGTRMEWPADVEWRLLKALDNPVPFATICETLAMEDPEVDVARLFPLFVQRGWVSRFELEDRVEPGKA